MNSYSILTTKGRQGTIIAVLCPNQHVMFTMSLAEWPGSITEAALSGDQSRMRRCGCEDE